MDPYPQRTPHHALSTSPNPSCAPPTPPYTSTPPPCHACRFSVIPRAAVGKVSVRFVPNQDAGHLVECLTAHMQHEFAKLRSGNELSVKVGAGARAGQGS